jgi:hypothetical protein
VKRLWSTVQLLLAVVAPAMADTVQTVQTVRIGPVDQSRVDVTLVLSPNTVKKCDGQFRGHLSVYEVTPEIPVAGKIGLLNGRCEVTVPFAWRSMTEPMIQHARSDSLQLRLSGDFIEGRAGKKVNWAVVANKSNLILTEPMKETVKRFAKAAELSLGGISLRDSTVNADITVQSPLGFDLRVSKISCALEIHGAVVAIGSKESFVLFTGRPTPLRIPVLIQHKALLSATGSVLSKMGKVNGKLFGTVQLRLPSGNMELPMEFPVHLNLI